LAKNCELSRQQMANGDGLTPRTPFYTHLCSA
jgi:hypothetical protein